MTKLRLIFYDKLTGNRLYDSSYNEKVNIEPTFDQIYEIVKELNTRTKESIGLIRYVNGEYDQDFAECGANFRIDLGTLTPLFSYPDPNQPTAPPIYQAPLSEQIAELRDRDAKMQDDLLFIMENMPV